MTTKLDSSLARRWAGKTFIKQRAASYARGLAPAAALLLFATTAHAQGTIDFTQATAVFTTIKVFVIAIGAVFVLIGLIFATVRIRAERIGEGMLGVLGALIGALIIGLGPGWITSLSGQQVQ